MIGWLGAQRIVVWLGGVALATDTIPIVANIATITTVSFVLCASR
jgi:hypothetical protein